jgi:hypothetical protein
MELIPMTCRKVLIWCVSFSNEIANEPFGNLDDFITQDELRALSDNCASRALRWRM